MKKRTFTIGVLFMLLFSAFIPITLGLNVRILNTNEPTFELTLGKTLYFSYDSIPFHNGKNGWNCTFGGESYDEGFSVQQTNDGGYITAGATLSYGAGNWDVWLIKTDYFGSEEWNSTFGGSDYDSCYSVQQTKDGGYILAGCTSSYGAGEFDVWLIKTDSDGDEVWNYTFGGSSVDWGYSVKQTSDNGYIITGYTDSYGAGNSDFWLIKTDSDGVQEWHKTFGGSKYDRGRSVQQTNDGGYVITGYTVSYDSDDSGCDVWLIKTDSNGVQEWHKTYGGSGIPNKFDMGYSVQQTDDGGYIIVGDTEIYFIDESDFLLIKTDSIGNEEWHKTFGGPASDRGRSVQQTKEGGYIILGWASSYGPGDSDIYLIKTDSNGNHDWNYTFEFEEDSLDWGYSVQQTKDGGYIIAGSTMPDGWLITGSSKSTEEEGTDIWLIKIAGENQPPNIPKIKGPTTVRPDIKYDYTFVSNDSDGDDICYYIDWYSTGDGFWTEFYASGEEVILNHTWLKSGTFTIKAKAKDVLGEESDWGYLTVTIPRNRATIGSFWLRFFELFPILQKILGYNL